MKIAKKNMDFWDVLHLFPDEAASSLAMREIQIKSVKDMGFMV
ncbi:hypothetical protein [Anaerotignum sp.]